MTHKFDPNKWAKLESPERRAVLPPEQILEQIGLREGETFVDVGAGTGYFAIPAAGRVGARGQVWAVDISRQMLELIADRISSSSLPIELLLSEETNIPLRDGVADHVFNSTVLHEIKPNEWPAFIEEMARLLKPAGRLTILDWAPVAEVTMGPPNHIRLQRSDVERLLVEAGLDIVSNEPFGTDFYVVQARMGAS